jgi:hypothetical protein
LRSDENGVGAETGAVTENLPPVDADLVALVNAWPTLPAALKAGIVAMVRAAGKEEQDP